MSLILNFLQSEHVLALLIAVLIFFITILLVAKRWIGFSLTFLFLLFSLIAGLLINYQHELPHYINSSYAISNEVSTEEDFHKHMLQAIEDLKIEVAAEKENLHHVMSQVQEIFNSMDIQKQKLQNFIEEFRESFRTDHSKIPSSAIVESPVEQTFSE